MTAPTLDHIPDILDEHFEELAWLLERRPILLHSPAAYLRDLASLDERILAHTAGVAAVEEPAVLAAGARLDGDDPAAIRAATFALLQLGRPEAVARLTPTFAAASGDALLAMTDAMLLVPAALSLQLAGSRAGDGDALAPVACARVLARHGGSRPSDAWLASRVRDASPLVRKQAWRLAGELGAALDPQSYAGALRDDDPLVRRGGMIAAAAGRMPGILAIARRAAERPSKDNAETLRFLAVLAEREDEKRLRYVCTEQALGVLRFELAGLHGAPDSVEMLIAAMSSDDLRAAVAAGAAYRRITGVNVESANRVELPPEDGVAPDEFEAEFQDEVILPDATKARDHWKQVGPSFQESRRVCGGFDATGPLSAGALDTLDLDSRWWQLIRARFNGWTVEGPEPVGVPPIRATA